MQARVPQGSVLSPTLYNLYINDTPQTPGVNLALFESDTEEKRRPAEKTVEWKEVKPEVH
jgi:hypothetical protein